MSNIGACDRLITNIDQHNQIRLRAIIKADTPIANLAKELNSDSSLFEVWLIPEDREAFDEGVLTRMSFNSIEELADFYDCNKSSGTCHTFGRVAALLEALKLRRTNDEVRVNVSTRATDFGPVISYVIGTRSSMKLAYHLQLLNPPLF
jgi:hypothetical protein